MLHFLAVWTDHIHAVLLPSIRVLWPLGIATLCTVLPVCWITTFCVLSPMPYSERALWVRFWLGVRFSLQNIFFHFLFLHFQLWWKNCKGSFHGASCSMIYCIAVLGELVNTYMYILNSQSGILLPVFGISVFCALFPSVILWLYTIYFTLYMYL